MAIPAHQDPTLAGEEHEPQLRPVLQSRPSPAVSASQPALPPVRRASPGAATRRRVGLFLKILLGDMTIWAVLSGVLTYEVWRRGLESQHAAAGALAGLVVAIAVSIGLKQVANRVVRLNRSALEISRGDLSKPLHAEPSPFGGYGTTSVLIWNLSTLLSWYPYVATTEKRSLINHASCTSAPYVSTSPLALLMIVFVPGATPFVVKIELNWLSWMIV